MWVYREDGTVQCSDTPGETLQHARDTLIRLVGAENVVGDGERRKVPGLHIALCGAPTGWANAFEITPAGAGLLRGFAGPSGFKPWIDHFDIDPGFHPADHLLAEETWAVDPSQDPSTPATRDPDRPFPHIREDGTLSIGAPDQGEPIIPMKPLMPWSAEAIRRMTSVKTTPTSLRDLVGWSVRVISPHMALTREFRFDRVNFYVNESGVITDIAFF